MLPQHAFVYNQTPWKRFFPPVKREPTSAAVGNTVVRDVVRTRTPKPRPTRDLRKLKSLQSKRLGLGS